MADEEHVLRGPRRGIPAHARGVGGHSGHHDADGIGTLGEQPRHRLGGDVALDDVVADERGVAGVGLERDADLAAQRFQIRVFGGDDRRPVVGDVVRPLAAAPSAGFLVDVDLDTGEIDRGPGRRRGVLDGR